MYFFSMNKIALKAGRKRSTMLKVSNSAKVLICLTLLAITEILSKYSLTMHATVIQKRALDSNKYEPIPVRVDEIRPAQTLKRTAIVYTTKYLSKCKAILLEHLLQTRPPTMDVWLLHNHDVVRQEEVLQQSLHNLNYLKQKYGLRDRTQELVVFRGHFDDGRSGHSKSSFLKWMMDHSEEYDYAWGMEDDILVTGEWKNLFELYDSHEADFVSTRVNHAPNWGWYHRNCSISRDYIARAASSGMSVRYNGTLEERIPCNRVLRWGTMWPLIRISKQGAKYLWEDLLSGALSGHHEAIVQGLLLGHGDLTFTEFPLAVAHIIAGGWGPYKNSTELKLQIFYPVTASKVYHPVKCDSYRGVVGTAEFEKLMISYGWKNSSESFMGDNNA
jgi:hypothetical protein